MAQTQTSQFFEPVASSQVIAAIAPTVGSNWPLWDREQRRAWIQKYPLDAETKLDQHKSAFCDWGILGI